MKSTSAIILIELLRNRAIIGYFIILALGGWGVFMLESQPQKALLGLMQLVLLVMPLMTLVFAATYYYNSREFVMLLLAQPVSRRQLFNGLYGGLGLAFSAAFLIGAGLPLLIFYPGAESGLLILAGVLLSFVFSGLALLIGTNIGDKARGLGVSILVWAFFAFLFDGLLLLLMYQFAAYPVERPVLVLTFLNPVDVARIMVVMQTEAAALLGLSGAVFREFFGSLRGTLISVLVLGIWILVPYLIARRRFSRMDF